MKKTAVFSLMFSILTALSHQAGAVVAGSEVDKKTLGSGGAEDYILGLRTTTKDPSGTATNYCTAVAISPQALLTAAHCARKGSTVTAVYGVNADGGKSYGVKAVFTKAGYNSGDVYDAHSLNNDLAILQLKKPLENVRVARLPEATESLPSGLNLTVIGYGRTSLTHRSVSNPDFGRLRKGSNNLYKAAGGSIVINQTSLSGICEGDSGGPLLQQTATGFTVWGIARAAQGSLTAEQSADVAMMRKDPARFLSKYKGLDFCRGHGKYTDVRSYMAWIKSTLSSMK